MYNLYEAAKFFAENTLKSVYKFWSGQFIEFSQFQSKKNYKTALQCCM